MKEALIIIDVQNDYFEGGACELHNPRAAEARIAELISESRKLGRHIIYIRHINPDDESFFNEGTYGCEISERIKAIEEGCEALTNARKVANKITPIREKAIAYHDTVEPLMQQVRYHIDKLEEKVDDEEWTLPKYREMLFMR